MDLTNSMNITTFFVNITVNPGRVAKRALFDKKRQDFD
jgi:hypothetical protein